MASLTPAQRERLMGIFKGKVEESKAAKSMTTVQSTGSLTPIQRERLMGIFKEKVAESKKPEIVSTFQEHFVRARIARESRETRIKEQLRSEYFETGPPYIVPVWASEQMTVPEPIVKAGAGKKYKQVYYEMWLGIDTTKSSEELERLLRLSEYYMSTQPVYTGGKTLQELKVDEPALYLEQTSTGEWTPKLDVVQFQREQAKDLGLAGFAAKAGSISILTFPITVATMIPEIFGGVFEATKEHGPLAASTGATLGFIRGKEKTIEKIASWEYETQKGIWKGDPLAYAKLYLASPAMTDVVYPFAIGAGATAAMGYIGRAGASIAATRPVAGAVMKVYPYAAGTVMSGMVGADIGATLAMEHKGIVPSGETGAKITRLGMQLGMMGVGGYWATRPETIAYYRGVQQKLGVVKTKMTSYFEPLSTKITGFKARGIEMGRMKSMVKDYPFHVLEGKGVPLKTRLAGVGSRIKTSLFEPSPYTYKAMYAPETIGIQMGRTDVLLEHRPIGSSRFVTTREQIQFTRPDPFMSYKTQDIWGGYGTSWEYYSQITGKTLTPRMLYSEKHVIKPFGKTSIAKSYLLRGRTPSLTTKEIIIPGKPIGYRYIGETKIFKSPHTYESYGPTDVSYRFIGETKPFKSPHTYESYGPTDVSYRFIGETKPFKSPHTYESYGPKGVGYRYIGKTRPLPKFKKTGWPEIYRSMEFYKTPSEPIPKTITVPKTITTPQFTTIGGFKSIIPTTTKTGISIPSGWAIATGHISLGFLEWLETGTAYIHPRWSKTFPTKTRLKTDISTNLIPRIRTGKISTSKLDTEFKIDTISLLESKFTFKFEPSVETIKAKDILSAKDIKYEQILAMKQRLDLATIPSLAQKQVQRQRYREEIITRPTEITPIIAPTSFTPSFTIPFIPGTGDLEFTKFYPSKRRRKMFDIDRWRIHPVEMKWKLVEDIV